MKTPEYSIRLAGKADSGRWDDYVTSSPHASPYHLFAWKTAVEEAYGHRGYYLLAEEKGEVMGILPLFHLHFPFLVNELAALPFCDVGNMVCGNEEVADLLLTEAFKLSEKLETGKIHLRGNMNISQAHSGLIHPEATQKVRMFLDLPDSSEALLQGFKSKLRSQIRKAEKNGVSFYWGGKDNLDEYYSVFSENMRDLGSPVHSRRWFASILENYRNNARLGIVAAGDRVIGGCILLSAGKRVSIPWASTLRRHNKLAPNMLLYWNVLKYSADAGFSSFDFGRSSPAEGTYAFKKQWGATPLPLRWYTTSTPPKNNPGIEPSNAGSGKREILVEIWRKLPVPLANFLGPRIRKYISL